MPRTPSDVLIAASDLIDKVSTPTSRAGITVNRVGKLLDAGLHPEDVAGIMTRNTANAQRFSPEMIRGLGLLYEATKTKAPLTAKQTKALLQDCSVRASTTLKPA